MRSSGITKTKRSYMSCEITLFQKDRIPVNNPMTISEGNRLVNNLIDDCFECNNHFRFYKTKK